VSNDGNRAYLVAAGIPEPNTPDGGGRPEATPAPTDSFLTPAPTPRPDAAIPYLPSIELRWYDDVESLHRDWERGLLDGVSGLAPDDAREFAGADGGRLIRYPGTTLLAVVLNLRVGSSPFLDPKVRTALLQAIDRDALVAGPLAGLAVRADSLIPPSSPVFDAAASPPKAYAPDAAREALTAAGWTQTGGSWRPNGATDPVTIEVLSPEEPANPVAYAAAAAVTAAWRGIGFSARQVPLPASELLGQRLPTGDFQAAVLPVALGLDPDLYPLLAASQTRTGGSNVSGLQDPELDRLLEAARTSLGADERRAAYTALQERLAAYQYLLPLVFRDEYFVLRDTLGGPAPRPIGGVWERYWDVLTWRLADGR
jgi:peptide/nickel transport system substrate-binding protein